MKNKWMLGLVLFSLNMAVNAYAQNEHSVSGRVKVFKGPEGEIITMMPVDQNKNMVVLTQNTYGLLEGKSILYENPSFDSDSPILTCTDPVSPDETASPGKRIFFSRHDGIWTYMDVLSKETGRGLSIKLTYSEELSKKADAQKILKKVEVCLAHKKKTES